MNQIKITQIQARSLAANIYDQIKAYTEEHQAEFEKFLHEEAKKNAVKSKNSIPAGILYR